MLGHHSVTPSSMLPASVDTPGGRETMLNIVESLIESMLTTALQLLRLAPPRSNMNTFSVGNF